MREFVPRRKRLDGDSEIGPLLLVKRVGRYPTTVEGLLQEIGIDLTVSANGDDVRFCSESSPTAVEGEVHAFADHLQHCPLSRRVAALDHAFAAVDTAW